jgi:mitogen-activated protein kinase kinase kinase
MERPNIQTLDSGSSGDSADSPDHLDPRHTPMSSVYSSLDGRPAILSMNSSIRSHRSNGDTNGTYGASTPLNGTASRPQRPTAPARTPSNTYAPPRRPPQPPYISMGDRGRSGSTARFRQDPNASYRAQEKAYVQRLQQDPPTEYFEQYTPSTGYGSDSEDDSPSDLHYDNDPYEQETLMFYGNDDIQPTVEDLKDPANRERLEWHGMLASVLTGDVVRQEKRRLIGASDKQEENVYAEIWLGIRSKITGRTLAAQRRMIEDSRSTLENLLDQIIKFEVQGESEAGKPPIEQVQDVVKKIEKCEGLYPSRMALELANKSAASPLYHATCDAIISWHNTTELINTELSILQNWVGNPELDFTKAKETSPSGNTLSDDASFIERLLKEDGLRSLQGDKSILIGVSKVILKAKNTLIKNSEAFAKRHLPPYIEELLTLINFPSRLIEEIIKVRTNFNTYFYIYFLKEKPI